MTASEVLANAKRASGRLDGENRTLRMTATYRDGGLTGSRSEVWSGENYRSQSTDGPFTTAEGRNDGQLWETNENGYTLLKRGLHKRAAANARALENADAGDDVRLLGRLHAPADVFVLRVAPADGRPERRFYDASTFRLVRRETAYLDRLVVTTFDDYRTVHGITLPFTTTVSDGHPENDFVETITNAQFGVPVLPDEVAIPGSRRLPVTLPPGGAPVRLPARIDAGGHVIVRLTIAGRGLDFQLDSGADGIVLNRDIARQLNLPTYGRWSNTVAGTFTSTRAIVPKMEIGAVTMTDVVVAALPFATQNDDATRIVGLLGFDFIAGCVVKIDYANGVVEAIPSTTFQPPNDAVILDAVLDDAVPMVSMRINGADGEHFILDTGADAVVMFSGFAKAHPAAIADHSKDRVVSRYFDVVNFEGVGGKLTLSAAMIELMQLGNVRYPNYIAFVLTGNQPAFEGEDADGLIGADVLRSFDVYLDYMNSRVLLVPNKYTTRAKD